ncbi:uncharacterized protein pxb [Prorops nasuta]|uniref:uncharacterized protein pxb n=1 Tax=Prorops nasuta TaxID=863751 RepID=UPI0034CDC6C7
MEELETLESSECPECPGPPPEFRLPPPPRPPFLTEGTFCSETPLAELEDCVAIPMIDASHHTNPSLQSTALIVTCAVVLLLMAAIVSVVFWKHKRKVQNLLPCKSATGSATASAVAAAGRGRVLPSDGPHRPGSGGGAAGTILYEDLPDAVAHHHLAGQAATIEMLDVKDGGRGVFVCSSPGPDPYTSQDLYNPVYEELSNGDHIETDEENELNVRNRLHQQRHHHHHHRTTVSKPASEDEFAEDELSIGEASEARMLTSSSGPTWGTCPAASRQSRERRGRSPRSLDRRRRDKNYDFGEFHEGMLLDALLQLNRSVAGVAGARTSNNVRQQSVPSVAHRLPYFVPPMPATQALRVEENPYESVPVLGQLHRYSTQNRSNKEKSRNNKEKFSKYSHYGTEYYGLQNQEGSTPVYSHANDEYSDAYAQPTDRLYNEDKYAQPIYYEQRDPEQATGKLYQGQPDSSFGSDSGYSHHTTGTSGTRGSNSRTNHRKDKHRNSHHSHQSTDYIVS